MEKSTEPTCNNEQSAASCCASTSCCGDAASTTTVEGTSPITANLPEWACGTLNTPVGTVYQVSTTWTRQDHWGEIRARVSSFRMRYAIPPGLYAVGTPDDTSDVFVSANYKLSFDVLRRELQGLNAWILVLDTKGINVWCAAGKGTFGTTELVQRIRETQLNKVVSHTRIIAPQLGAPGVNAAEVKRQTGFRVLFGPVRAKDIPTYIQANYKASQAMRTVTFPLLDRVVLTPMELVPAFKKFPVYAGIVLLVFGLQPAGILFKKAWIGGLPFLLLGVLAILAGAFLTPILLPVVPFRSFAIKGWIVGLLTILAGLVLTKPDGVTHPFLMAASYLFFPLMASYVALQFTGTTTFTSMSGVKKELRIGLPIYLIGVVASAILLIVYKLNEWGIV